MMSLEEFNRKSFELYSPYALGNLKPELNGIACPDCGKELYDTTPDRVLASNPPQLDIHCDCGYKGYRYR